MTPPQSLRDRGESAATIRTGASSYAGVRPPSPGLLHRWLLRRIGATITIDVRPDGLHVWAPRGEVHVPKSAGGVGSLYGNQTGPADYMALVAVLRDAFAMIIHGWRLPLRPIVVWRGIAGCETPATKDLAAALERAAFEAGAIQVRFDASRPEGGDRAD